MAFADWFVQWQQRRRAPYDQIIAATGVTRERLEALAAGQADPTATEMESLAKFFRVPVYQEGASQRSQGKKRKDNRRSKPSGSAQREKTRERLGDQELKYLIQARDAQTPHRFVLLNGSQHEGVVRRFDRYVIEVARKRRPPVVIRKLALAYYHAIEVEGTA